MYINLIDAIYNCHTKKMNEHQISLRNRIKYKILNTKSNTLQNRSLYLEKTVHM